MPPNADYFLPRFGTTPASFVPKVATSTDLAGMFTLALISVKLPEISADTGVVKLKDEPFISDALAASITGHSERSTITSVLAALGVQKAEREYLGRWSGGGADEYVRTYRAVVRKLLQLVRDIVGKDNAYVVLDEGEAFEALRDIAIKKGSIEEQTEADCKRGKESAKTLFSALAARRAREQNPSGERIEEYKAET